MDIENFVTLDEVGDEDEDEEEEENEVKVIKKDEEVKQKEIKTEEPKAEEPKAEIINTKNKAQVDEKKEKDQIKVVDKKEKEEMKEEPKVLGKYKFNYLGTKSQYFF